jgi:hypothetical protein
LVPSPICPEALMPQNEIPVAWRPHVCTSPAASQVKVPMPATSAGSDRLACWPTAGPCPTDLGATEDAGGQRRGTMPIADAGSL